MKPSKLFFHKKSVSPAANENGSAIVIVLLIIALLSVIAFSVNRTATTESMIVRNVLEGQQEFYFTEGAIFSVAQSVNSGGVFAVTYIDRKTIFTPITYSGATVAEPIYEMSYSATDWDAIVDNFTDEAWPARNTGTNTEYAYRVYYKGPGENPKGYGKGFTTYLFDVAARKQLSSAGVIQDSSVIINKGHRKVGPKVS